MPQEDTIVISRNELTELQALSDLFRSKLSKLSSPDQKKKKSGLSDAQKAKLLMQKNKNLVK